MTSVRKKNSYSISCLLALALTPIFAHAALPEAAAHFCQLIKSGRPIVSLGTGAAITSDLGNDQSFFNNQPVSSAIYEYAANSTTQVEPIFDVFIGEEWLLTPKWALQLGLGYSQTAPYEVSGDFVQEIPPLFIVSVIGNNYRYNITARRFLAESKLQYLFMDRYRPYVFLGLGIANNTASNYYAYVPLQNLTRQFQKNTETSFAYSLGIGLDVEIIEQVRFGVGYRFSDLGSSSLGQSTIFGNNVSGTLSQNHMYTNEVLAQITFTN